MISPKIDMRRWAWGGALAALVGCGGPTPAPNQFAPQRAGTGLVSEESQPTGPLVSLLQPATPSPSDSGGSGSKTYIPSQATIAPLRSFRDLSIEETATEALGRIGEPAVPALVALLSDPRVEVRRLAAEILARIGPDAKGAVGALVPAIHDSDPEVRRMAIRALGQIGPAAGHAVPELIEVLKADSK